MCGRFALTSNLSELQGRFGFIAERQVVEAKYNIAPTDPVLTVINDGQRRGEIIRWGLIPFWAKDAKTGSRMINAVGETVAAKPAFRNAFRKRRCLVLANGFFEWKKNGKQRIPQYIFLKSGEPMAFAGLWETWKSPEGEYLRSCAIVTTTPNSFIEPVHNRTPVVLSQETESLWLDPLTEDPKTLEPLLIPSPEGEYLRSCAIVTTTPNSFIEPVHNRTPVVLSQETESLWLDPLTEDPKTLEPLLIPSPPELMDSYTVSRYVNSVRNQGPACIGRADEAPGSAAPPDGARLFD